MADIERMRQWLRSCRSRVNDDLSENDGACEACPYFENGSCSPWAMFDDALELLEELEQKQ